MSSINIFLIYKRTLNIKTISSYCPTFGIPTVRPCTEGLSGRSTGVNVSMTVVES